MVVPPVFVGAVLSTKESGAEILTLPALSRATTLTSKVPSDKASAGRKVYVVPFLTTSDDVASVNADTDVLRMPKPTATTPLLSVTEAVNVGRALEVVVSPDSEITGSTVSIVKVAVAVSLTLLARS